MSLEQVHRLFGRLNFKGGSKIASAMVLIEEVAEFSVLSLDISSKATFNKLRHEVETEEKVVEPIVEDSNLTISPRSLEMSIRVM